MESPAETKEDEKGSLVVGGVDAAAAYMAPAYPLDDPYGYPAIEVDVGLMLNCKKMGVVNIWKLSMRFDEKNSDLLDCEPCQLRARLIPK